MKMLNLSKIFDMLVADLILAARMTIFTCLPRNYTYNSQFFSLSFIPDLLKFGYVIPELYFLCPDEAFFFNCFIFLKPFFEAQKNWFFETFKKYSKIAKIKIGLEDQHIQV